MVTEKLNSTAQIWCCVFLYLLVFGDGGSDVKFLPGFQGPLPFELETGYIGVGESEDVQLFYYFTKSESQPESDPIILWLTGGPGCSALSGLLFEIGPFTLEKEKYNGSLPRIVLNPYSWSKVASIIFLDSPVGTGFSYAKTPSALQSSDMQTCHETYEFVRKWLNDHPEFISNPFYVAGDSYSGILVPIISQFISDGNEMGIHPQINLQGYMLGNPLTFPEENDYKIQFAHGMALISDELYESLQVHCNGKYQSVDPSNAKCLQDINTFNELINGLDGAQILDWTCGFAVTMVDDIASQRRRSLHQQLNHHPLSAIKCHIDWYRLSYYWADNESVRDALHIKKGSIGSWTRCNLKLQYKTTTWNSIPYHANLSAKGYSGDHDMMVPFLSTQAWIRSLNYSIIDEWRQWTVEGQVAGFIGSVTMPFTDEPKCKTVRSTSSGSPQLPPSHCSPAPPASSPSFHLPADPSRIAGDGEEHNHAQISPDSGSGLLV
nr:serine carboxypeptidase-like 17 isoform X1 [Ipomoea trifida]